MKKLQKAQKGKYTGQGPYNPYEEGADMQNAAQMQGAINVQNASLQGAGFRLNQALAQGNQSQPTQFETERTFGEDINWKHVLASHAATSIGMGIANMSSNSYGNAVKRYNEQQYSPTSYLPYTANYSLQDQFGIKEFQDGGEVGEDDMMKFLFEDDVRTADAPVEKKKVVQQVYEDNGPSDEEIFNSMDFRRSIPRRQRFKDDEVSLDPNVVAATKELQAKFPGLQITSTIRNWGDKDAHPKGRAIDLAGNGSDEAWKYYSDVIVPKYGFNKALDPNHGTGKHIHVGYYQQGGRTPIYTTNPNDPRIRNYQDSLSLYNYNTYVPPDAKGMKKRVVYKDNQGKGLKFYASNGNVPVSLNHWSADFNLNNPDEQTTDIWSGNHAKPVQPVVYKKQDVSGGNTSTVWIDETGKKWQDMDPKGYNYKPRPYDRPSRLVREQQFVPPPHRASMRRNIPLEEDVRQPLNPSRTNITDRPDIPYVPQGESVFAPNGHLIGSQVNGQFIPIPLHKSKEMGMQQQDIDYLGGEDIKTYLKYKGIKMKKGGINTTGYLDESKTAGNDYNIIPGGDITMQGVSQPILATPIKGGRPMSPIVMLPGEEHQFDADYVYEERLDEMHLGGSRHGKMSKTMARKILYDGEVEGRDLTKRQQHYFKHIAAGDIKFKNNKPVMKYEAGGSYELTQQEIDSLKAQGYEFE